METKLHSDVITIAKENPALVFSLESLKSFFLANFLNAKNLLLTHSVSIDGSSKVQARLITLSIAEQSVIELTNINNAIFVGIKTNFNFEFALHEAGNQQNEFSRIKLSINNFKSLISVNAPNLIIDTPDFDLIPFDQTDPNHGPIYPSATRSNAITHAGISEQDVLNIEGALAFVMPRRIILSMFTTINKIDLTQLFTAFELKGEWELNMVEGGLIIIPSGGITIKENLGCPISDSLTALSVTNPSQPLRIDGQTNYSWPILISGIPQVVTHQANNTLNGFASLYLPKVTLDQRFSSVMPAITYSEDSNSFIGYNFSFSASFEYVGIDIDTARNGFVINLNFLAQGNAGLYINIPCIGECDLAHANLKIGVSNLRIYTAFVFSKDGKLVLQSQVDNINIGNVDVSISFFAQIALAFAGGEGAVVGFILDQIADRIIARIIPSKIQEFIKKTVNSNNIQLLNLETLERFADFGNATNPHQLQNAFNTVTYSASDDIDKWSILTGLMYNR